jgi:predicted dehydrogenase
MFDLGSHLVDAAARLLGRPQKVTPFLHHHGQGADQLNDNNIAVLEYERAQAVIVNTALQPTETPQRSFEVVGSNGSALLSSIEPPALQFELIKAAGPYGKGLQKVPLPDYQRHVADFAALAAAVRGQSALPVTLGEELAVQETLLKACGML